MNNIKTDVRCSMIDDGKNGKTENRYSMIDDGKNRKTIQKGRSHYEDFAKIRNNLIFKDSKYSTSVILSEAKYPYQHPTSNIYHLTSVFPFNFSTFELFNGRFL